ncbi:MAG: hypothetical protein AB1673_08530 [Actinomycetota bacterium]
MGRFTRITLLAAISLATAACGGGGGGDASATSTTTTAAPTTTTAAPTGPVTELTLRVTEVRLINSEDSDSGMRVLLPPGVPSASVTLAGLPSPNRVISVCQARELAARMLGATCRMPQNGEAVTIELGQAASGIEIAQVGVVGPGPEGNSAAIEQLTVRYSAGSREVSVRLPQIAAGEGAGRPTFAMTPAATTGEFQAALSWVAIPQFGGTVSAGQLELLRDGEPVQTESSAADTRMSGTVAPPGAAAAIRVQNSGSTALVTPTVTLLLP